VPDGYGQTITGRAGAPRRPPDELGAARTLTINRLHPAAGRAHPRRSEEGLDARQARALLADVAAGDVVRETRRQLAAELVDELEVIDAQIKTAKKQLAALVAKTGSGLMRLNGIGPFGAARLLGDIGDIGDISRFPTGGHFASWNGTAPLDASSDEQTRHRLSRAGTGGSTGALHIMAVVQLRHPATDGRRHRRQDADGGHPHTQTATVRCGLRARSTRPEQPGGPRRPNRRPWRNSAGIPVRHGTGDPLRLGKRSEARWRLTQASEVALSAS
jgi:transposase